MGRIMVMVWMRSPNILPWGVLPQLKLSRRISMLYPQQPLGVPPLLLSFPFHPKNISHLGKKRGKLKEKNNNNKKNWDQQVSNTRDSYHFVMQGLYGSRGTDAPIVNFTVATTKPMTMVVPLSSSSHTTSPFITPVSPTLSSPSFFNCVILYVSSPPLYLFDQPTWPHSILIMGGGFPTQNRGYSGTSLCPY